MIRIIREDPIQRSNAPAPLLVCFPTTLICWPPMFTCSLGAMLLWIAGEPLLAARRLVCILVRLPSLHRLIARQGVIRGSSCGWGVRRLSLVAGFHNAVEQSLCRVHFSKVCSQDLQSFETR